MKKSATVTQGKTEFTPPVVPEHHTCNGRVILPNRTVLARCPRCDVPKAVPKVYTLGMATAVECAKCKLFMVVVPCKDADKYLPRVTAFPKRKPGRPRKETSECVTRS